MKKFFYLCSILFLLNIFCGKPTDKQAYEQVLSTLSIESAKNFFKNYPESPYANQLAMDLIDACARDNNDCCNMVLKAIPENNKRYMEYKDLCKKRAIKK